MSQKDDKHIVRRNVFEIAVGSRGDVNRIQNDISRLFNQTVIKLLDKIFTEIGNPEFTYRIDYLELDLGTVSQRYMERELTERLEKQLRAKLKDMIGMETIDVDTKYVNLSISTRARTDREIIMHFLETGHLSFWTNLGDQSMEELMLESIEKSPTDFKVALAKIGKQPSVIQRIHRQFSKPTISKIIKTMVPTEALFIASYARELERKFNKSRYIQGLSTTLFNDVVQESILHFLLVEKSISFSKKTFLKSVELQLKQKTGFSMLELLAPEEKKKIDEFKELETFTASQTQEVNQIGKILISTNWKPPKTLAAQRKLAKLVTEVLESRSWKLRDVLVKGKTQDWKKVFNKLEEIAGPKQLKTVERFKKFFVLSAKKEKQEELAKLLNIKTEEVSWEKLEEKARKDQEVEKKKREKETVKQRFIRQKIKKDVEEILAILRKQKSKITTSDKAKLKEKLQLLLEKQPEYLAKEIIEIIHKEIREKKSSDSGNKKSLKKRKEEIDNRVEEILSQIESAIPNTTKPKVNEFREFIRKEKNKKRAEKPEEELSQSKEDEIVMQLDFVTFFLKEGKAPWWSTGQITGKLEEVALNLWKDVPEKVTGKINKLLKKATQSEKQRIVKTITTHFSDKGIEQLVEALEPDFVGFVMTQILAIEKLIDQKTELNITASASDKIKVQWMPVLQYVIVEKMTTFNVQEFVKTVVQHLALQLSLPVPLMVQKLKSVVEKAAKSGESRFSPMVNMLQNLAMNPPSALPENDDLEGKKRTIAETNPTDVIEQKEDEEAYQEGTIQIDKSKEQFPEKDEENKSNLLDQITGDQKNRDDHTILPSKETEKHDKEETIDPKTLPIKETTQSDRELDAPKKELHKENENVQEELSVSIENAVDAVAYFMSKGSLPSDIAEFTKEKFEKLFEFALAEKPLTVRDIIQKWARTKQTRSRMAVQFSKELLLKVIRRLKPSSESMLKFGDTLMEIAKKSGEQKVIRGVREYMIYHAVYHSQTFDTYVYYKNVVKSIARERSMSIKDILDAFEKAVKSVQGSEANEIKKLTVLLIKEFEEKPQKMFDSISGKKDQAAPEPKIVKEEEAIFVNNAGIVLVTPLLSFYFQTLGMLDPLRKFKDLKTAYRAVHLLQYIGTKQEETPEYMLTLNKILCGVPFGAPLEIGIKLTDYEKSLSDQLIMQIVKRWPMVKNSSADGMRGSYFIRDGRMTKRDSTWRLKVEKKSYDMLMASFPWSFAMIKLPWMTNHKLFVEWGNTQI